MNNSGLETYLFLKLMNEPQETICRIVLSILKIDKFRDNINTPAYSYILSQIIRQYAEINNNYQKTWKNIELCRQHHQFTSRAASVLDLDEYQNPTDEKIWQVLHYEHIVPIKVIINELLGLYPCKLNYKNVVKIMRQNEVVILTKKEASVLDGSVSQLYCLDGELVPGKGMRSTGNKKKRLEAISAQIDERYLNNSINQ
ncbi:MAG: hypothetical protein GT597_00990 [Bacteroidales bacterium]|jgi:hypothetical protein|nr:hypothetical protein [Bacteroidales bacterium]HNY52958.1 hypothetical protein [Bacteroidales bacterium]HQB86393.1 hypothetical protein [Bacteroidales bacterium]